MERRSPGIIRRAEHVRRCSRIIEATLQSPTSIWPAPPAESPSRGHALLRDPRDRSGRRVHGCADPLAARDEGRQPLPDPLRRLGASGQARSADRGRPSLGRQRGPRCGSGARPSASCGGIRGPHCSAARGRWVATTTGWNGRGAFQKKTPPALAMASRSLTGRVQSPAKIAAVRRAAKRLRSEAWKWKIGQTWRERAATARTTQPPALDRGGRTRCWVPTGTA